MYDLKQQLKFSLTNKKINTVCVWNFCLTIIKKFYNNKFKITWSIKNSIIFLNVNPSYAKNMIFLNKTELINKVNLWLKNLWYAIKIKDIILK